MANVIVDLIRHGQPEGGNLYRGHNIDDPLSNTGWQQMRDAINGIPRWNQIITSPLQRCHAFASELGQKHQLAVSVEEDFKEVGFGDWEGKTREQLKVERMQEYQDFYRDPVNCRPANAEILNDFISRVTQAYQSHITRCAGQHILIVAHAGVIRAIIAHTLNATPIGLYRIKVDNAGITRILHDGESGYLLKLNVKLNEIEST